jgi:hypothetical protein
MLRIPATIPNRLPNFGFFKIRGIVAISATTMVKKKNNHPIDTLFCGLVSNPIGAGNSRIVRKIMATTQPIIPILNFLAVLLPSAIYLFST